MQYNQQIEVINKTSDHFREAFETAILDCKNHPLIGEKNARFTSIVSAFVAITHEMQHMRQEDRYILVCTFMHALSTNELEWVKVYGMPKK